MPDEWDVPTLVDNQHPTGPHDLTAFAARHEGREDVFRALYAVMRTSSLGLTPGEQDAIVLAVRQRLTQPRTSP